MSQWYGKADHSAAFKAGVMRGLLAKFQEGEVRFLSHAIGYILRLKDEETEGGVRDAIQELSDGVTRVALMVCPQYAAKDVRKGPVVERILRYAADACEFDSRETYNNEVPFEELMEGDGRDPQRLAAGLLMLNRVSWHRDGDEYIYVTSEELLDQATAEQAGGAL